jgi:hypothetical protein
LSDICLDSVTRADTLSPQLEALRKHAGAPRGIPAAQTLINYDTADRFSLMHQIESLVDVGERHHVGDHRVDLDLAVHVPVDDFGHIGAAARATECGPGNSEASW